MDTYCFHTPSARWRSMPAPETEMGALYFLFIFF
jgi:hypothetical protein